MPAPRRGHVSPRARSRSDHGHPQPQHGAPPSRLDYSDRVDRMDSACDDAFEFGGDVTFGAFDADDGGVLMTDECAFIPVPCPLPRHKDYLRSAPAAVVPLLRRVGAALVEAAPDDAAAFIVELLSRRRTPTPRPATPEEDGDGDMHRRGVAVGASVRVLRDEAAVRRHVAALYGGGDAAAAATSPPRSLRQWPAGSPPRERLGAGPRARRCGAQGVVTAVDEAAGSVSVDFGDRRPERFPWRSLFAPPRLHVAAWLGDADTIRAYLQRGVDSLERDWEGLTAIEVAVLAGHAAAAEVLQQEAEDSGYSSLSAAHGFNERLSVLLGWYDVHPDHAAVRRGCGAAGLQWSQDKAACVGRRGRVARLDLLPGDGYVLLSFGALGGRMHWFPPSCLSDIIHAGSQDASPPRCASPFGAGFDSAVSSTQQDGGASSCASP